MNQNMTMPKIQWLREKFKSFEDDNHDLNVSVSVLVMNLTIYPLFAVLFQYAQPNSVDSYLERLLVSSPSAVFLSLLFFVPTSRRFSQFFVTFAITTMTLHILFLLYRLNLNPTYVMGLYAVLSVCTALTVRISMIIFYTTTCMIGTLVVAVATKDPLFHPWLFIALAGVEAVLAATINIQKLNGYLNIGKERKKLIEAEKMASIGILAAGVAHEFNNPLAIIDGKSALLIKGIDRESVSPDKIKSELEGIRKTVGRLASIVRALLDIASKPNSKDNEICLFSDVLSNAMSFVQGRVDDKRIQMKISTPEDIRISGGLAQHALSLISNSIDAIADLEIPADSSLHNLPEKLPEKLPEEFPEEFPEKWIQISAEREDGHAVIRVTDSGKGIPEAIVERLFLPFFTTKEPGQGVGLGLSLAKAALQKMDGDLLYNRDSKNTEFLIRIPCEN